ncbi:MAG: thymidine phosphorylase, partial [Thermoplasmatota archaeon]
EAKEALAALEGKEVPSSLIEKSTSLAGMVLEQGGFRDGKKKAKELLESGKALEKMKEIIEHQGGDPDIDSESVNTGEYKKEVHSNREGYVDSINNHDIIQIVRTAGAPHNKGAGLILHKKKGDKVTLDEPLYTIHAEHKRKLDDAVKLANHLKPLNIEGMILEKHPDYENV